MQSTEKVCEHQNANCLAMMRERDDARVALAAERERADRAEALLNSLTPVLELTQGTAHTILRSVLIGGVYAPEATA